MIRHVLVAVDDSPAGLAALRLALDLARGWEAKVRTVTVVADHNLAERLRFALRDDDGRGATAGAAWRRAARAPGRWTWCAAATMCSGEDKSDVEPGRR